MAVVITRRCMASSSRGVAQRLSLWRRVAGVFVRHCTGVVFVRRCVGTEVRCCPHAASHSCRLRAAWRGGVFASPGGRRCAAVVFTCRCTAAVVFASPLLSQHCCLRGRGHRHRLSPSNQGRRGHIPSRAPANDGRGCAGAGHKWGDSHPPASARTLFAHERGAGRKEGGSLGKKGGHQRSIEGGAKARGHIPSAPLQTAGAVQGRGVMPLCRHESCSHTNGGAQKGAGAMQRKGVKGAAALPLRDSGANPVRAQTGGRAQKGGGLACNKGAGWGGITYLPALRKGGIREGPCLCVNGVGRTRPPV
jgi:hypothetical protein